MLKVQKNNVSIIILTIISLVVSYKNKSFSSDNDNFFKSPQLILEAVAGNGSGQFGFILFGDETYPKDFVVDHKGAIWVMDHINRRVQKFDAKGNYLLQFPDEINKSPLTLKSKYIECDSKGNVVIGPMSDGSMVVLKNDGSFLRRFKLPGIQHKVFDFALTASSEILYYKSGDIVAVDLTGQVLYAIPKGPIVMGSDTSPYSKYIAKNNYDKKQVDIYYGELNENKKSSIDMNYLNSQGPTKNGGRKRVLFADNEGNIFIETLIGDKPREYYFSFHASNGKHLQTLNIPSGLNIKEKCSLSHCTDSEGNFYIMEIQKPKGIEIKPRELIKGGSPCLRIWKWVKIKKE